jgi:O-antigen/teichoic acid export membrane protein
MQIGSQVLPLVAGAIGIPIVYGNIGRNEFGVFTIALSALGFFALLDLGLGRASVRFTARAFAEGNSAGAASVVAQSALLLGGFCLIMCVALLALTPYIADHWIHSQSAEHATLRQCLYILAAAVPIAGLTSVFRSVLEARENFAVISIIQACLGILTYIVPVLLSFQTTDVRMIVLGAVVCRFVAFGAFVVSARRAWGGPFPWKSVDLRAQREFREFSFWTTVSNVLGAAIVYADRALLVKIFGLTEIAFYNVPVELLSRVMIIVNSAATVVFPSLSRLSGNRVLFEGFYIGVVALTSTVVGAAFFALSVAAPTCLQLWLGADFRDHSSLIVRILLIGMVFQTLNVIALASLNARGFARPITAMHIVEAPLYIGALYFCGLRFGLIGVALVWSARLVMEYLCFTGFLIRAGAQDGIRRQLCGALLAAGNAAPAILMATQASVPIASLVCASCACMSIIWGIRELRAAQEHLGTLSAR